VRGGLQSHAFRTYRCITVLYYAVTPSLTKDKAFTALYLLMKLILNCHRADCELPNLRYPD